MKLPPAAAIAVLLAGLALGACYTSNVLDASQRAVHEPLPAVAWRPATGADFDGLFESAALEGDVAASVRALWYHFAPDGAWSGAALIADGDGARFTVLQGRFVLRDGTLELEPGAPPAAARAGGGHLRLESAAGCVVLRKLEDR
jgi:hypothetical protein